MNDLPNRGPIVEMYEGVGVIKLKLSHLKYAWTVN